jgi:cell wall assembly regulator SMI1
MLLRADPRRSPATVAASWGRISDWVAGHVPELVLCGGLAPSRLAEFEGEVGQRLPDDVRESYALHDGQASGPSLLFGCQLMCLLDDEVDSSLGYWRHWADVRRSLREDELAMLDAACSSSPSGAVRLAYSDAGWVPLTVSGANDHIGVDLAPGPRGTWGQVVTFGRDVEDKVVLAASWAHLLEDVADELCAGNVQLPGEEEFGLDTPSGSLLQVARRWSAAKVQLAEPLYGL